MSATAEATPRTLPHAGSGAVTQAEAEAMLRAVLTLLLERWRVTPGEARRLLGEPSERTFQRWRAGQVGPLPRDTVFRLGTLLGIHKALRYAFTAPERGYAWVRRANAAFGGRSALDRMLGGEPTDLAVVRAYLDAERGGW